LIRASCLGLLPSGNKPPYNQSQGGLVCRIESTGCTVGDCLCQCAGEPCVYWSYWRHDQDGWHYSATGATLRRLSDGDVDGWSWGPGSVTSAIEPPPVAFADICPDRSVQNSETLAVAAEPDGDWLAYGLFGLLVAALGLGVYAVDRKRRAS